MKKMKKTAALLLALVMSLSLFACGAKEEPAQPLSKIEQIKEAGVLVVGTSADYPPFQFHSEVDGVDTIVGVEISIAQYFADSLGVELKIVDMSFDNLVMSLKNGEFDIVASTMRPSDERKQSIDFTDSWYNNQTVLVVQKENESLFSKPEDLAGHTVAAQKGASQFDTAVEYAGADCVVGLSKAQDLILEVQTGKVEAAMLEALSAQAYTSANDDLVVVDVGIPGSGQNASIGVQKGNEDLVEYLNGLIAELKEKDLISQYVLESSALAGVE